MLASVALAGDGDSARVQSLAARVHCNCGCGEVLAQCSHRECQRSVPLKQEIASALLQGKSDDQILNNLAARYGATIMVVPRFRGFEVLLWIVPLAVALIALAVFLARQWPVTSAAQHR